MPVPDLQQKTPFANASHKLVNYHYKHTAHCSHFEYAHLILSTTLS